VVARAEQLAAPGGPRRAGVRQICGSDPKGRPSDVALRGLTAVVFVKTDCDGCAELAALVRDGIDGIDVIGAVRAPRRGLPDAELDALLGDRGRWVVGDQAFDSLDVRGAPFFCVLDANGDVLTEGLAFGRADIEARCAAALARRGGHEVA